MRCALYFIRYASCQALQCFSPSEHVLEWAELHIGLAECAATCFGEGVLEPAVAAVVHLDDCIKVLSAEGEAAALASAHEQMLRLKAILSAKANDLALACEAVEHGRLSLLDAGLDSVSVASRQVNLARILLRGHLHDDGYLTPMSQESRVEGVDILNRLKVLEDASPDLLRVIDLTLSELN